MREWSIRYEILFEILILINAPLSIYNLERADNLRFVLTIKLPYPFLPVLSLESLAEAPVLTRSKCFGLTSQASPRMNAGIHFKRGLVRDAIFKVF